MSISEIPVNFYWTTKRNNPEDSHLLCHGSFNLALRLKVLFLLFILPTSLPSYSVIRRQLTIRLEVAYLGKGWNLKPSPPSSLNRRHNKRICCYNNCNLRLTSACPGADVQKQKHVALQRMAQFPELLWQQFLLRYSCISHSQI
jgi:hypothetical protein